MSHKPKKTCVCVCVRNALNVYFNIQQYCIHEEKQTNVPNYGSLYSSTRALKQGGSTQLFVCLSGCVHVSVGRC